MSHRKAGTGTGALKPDKTESSKQIALEMKGEEEKNKQSHAIPRGTRRTKSDATNIAKGDTYKIKWDRVCVGFLDL